MAKEGNASPEPAVIELSRAGGSVLVVRLGGAWHLADALPPVSDVERELDRESAATVRLEASSVTDWDSGLVLFVFGLLTSCRARGVAVEHQALPGSLERMLALVQDSALPPAPPLPRGGWLERVGKRALAWREKARDASLFVGETTLALSRMLLGRARYRGQD